MATATATAPTRVRSRSLSSNYSENNISSNETKQPSGETSSERTTSKTTTPTTKKSEKKSHNRLISSQLDSALSQPQQLPPPSSSFSRSRKTATPTVISPRTRGNAIVLALASPNDLIHENNFVNDGAAAREAGGSNQPQNKFVSPSKRSTAEAALHFLARTRTAATRSLVGNVSKSDTTASPKQTDAAASSSMTTAPHTTIASSSLSSSLTTPGGRRRKRKAACEAQSKVRDICEMEDFDHLDELLMGSSQKIPYNESSSLAMNQVGRRKRTRRGKITATSGAAVSDIVVVADRSSAVISSSSSGMKNNHADKHILAVPANNDIVHTPAATLSLPSSFVPVGKSEERWFRNFQKWRSNSSTNTMPPPTSPPPKLWIREQRVQYNQWKQNKKTQMTQERIDLLESAGFCWEVPGRRKDGKGVAMAAARMTGDKESNDHVNNGNKKERPMSEDAHQSAEENQDRHNLEMRKSLRKVPATQFYLNLGKGSDAIQGNQSLFSRGLMESTTGTITPKSTSPKINRKKERRGRHSMSTLEALDVHANSSFSGDGEGGKAATKRSKLLTYKELDMAVSKSAMQKTRKKASIKLSTSIEKTFEGKQQDERKVDGKGSNVISHEATAPLIKCSDLSSSLESPLLITTRLSASSSSSNHPQPLPAVTAAANTHESPCVRKLILSCLSDEPSPDGSGAISNGSDDPRKLSTKACDINDENSSTILNHSIGGYEPSKSMVDVSASADKYNGAGLNSITFQSHPDSPGSVPRHEPIILDNAPNIGPGSHSNQRQPTAPCDDAYFGSPWEYDVGNLAYTSKPSDVDLLSCSPGQSNGANNPRRLFSSPVGNCEQSQTLIPPVNKSTRKETGTQTADFSSQTLVTCTVENQNASPSNDVNNEENSLRLFPPLSLTLPLVNDQQTQTIMQHDSAANANSEASDTQLANPSSRSLISSNVASHHHRNLGADLPVEFEAGGLPIVMAERQYQASMTNYGQLEIEMRLVTQRMREIEESMKLVDSSSMPNNGIESESYHSNQRSRSRRNSHHSSSNYYESSEDEYNSDEFYPPSPMRQRRSLGYLRPKEMAEYRSSRRATQKISGRKGRSRPIHDDRRSSSSNYHVLDIKKRRKLRPKSDERYRSDQSDSSEGFADYGYDRYRTQDILKNKIPGRNTPQDSIFVATSRESRPNRKQKRRHHVSSLEKASPSKPALADDHSENEESPHSAQSLADKASVVKPITSERMNSNPSAVIQRDLAIDDQKASNPNQENESSKHITCCALGGRSREPMFWLARGENSSDDESWDFDGPMILPPPPL